ncbi:hypothetical protein G6F37_006599 [Rhizopus arrhizus]|nr:hypothetical protein G6F38_004112 [Rhizopus arrhizus]KAG1157556.1 hypothetical protein G6F37_006599 [Rhizopus arrhizus]
MIHFKVKSSLHKILIFGGGLAGLVLANALKKQDISFSVYEQDTGPDTIEQPEKYLYVNLAYFKKYVSSERFENFDKEMGVNDEISIDNNTAFNSKDDQLGGVGKKANKAYRVSRNRFIKWLLQDIQSDVHWHKKLSHPEESKGQIMVCSIGDPQDTGDYLTKSDRNTFPVICKPHASHMQSGSLTCISNVSEDKDYAAVDIGDLATEICQMFNHAEPLCGEMRACNYELMPHMDSVIFQSPDANINDYSKRDESIGLCEYSKNINLRTTRVDSLISLFSHLLYIDL